MTRNNRDRATATSTSTPALGQGHLDDGEEIGMVAEDERQQRVGFLRTAHDQRERQEGVGDAQQQDHHGQKQ